MLIGRRCLRTAPRLRREARICRVGFAPPHVGVEPRFTPARGSGINEDRKQECVEPYHQTNNHHSCYRKYVFPLSLPGMRNVRFAGSFPVFEKAQDQLGKGITRPVEVHHACQIIKEGAFQETEDEEGCLPAVGNPE